MHFWGTIRFGFLYSYSLLTGCAAQVSANIRVDWYQQPLCFGIDLYYQSVCLLSPIIDKRDPLGFMAPMSWCCLGNCQFWRYFFLSEKTLYLHFMYAKYKTRNRNQCT